GSDKGSDFTPFAQRLVAIDNLRAIICIGQSGSMIAAKLNKAGYKNGLLVKSDATMKEIVESASDFAESGDVVLLSPASASFDQYKSYADRGDQFIKSVEEL